MMRVQLAAVAALVVGVSVWRWPWLLDVVVCAGVWFVVVVIVLVLDGPLGAGRGARSIRNALHQGNGCTHTEGCDRLRLG